MADQPTSGGDPVAEATERALRGGAPKYHQKLAEQGKLFVRERLRLLLDDADGFVEDGLLTGALDGDLPADAVVTGVGNVHGRPVAVMANDSTVKAGSWGPRTVEKIIRIIELARGRGIPIVYLVDSAGARITDQVNMFPGRRGAGRIFHNQVKASGSVPQVCCLFGPSAAGGAYIPSLCDVTFMVEHNASMYLGSPRMAEEVIGEQVTLEEMGGARMHSEVSGSSDLLVPDDKGAIDAARAYLSYFPQSWREQPPLAEGRPPAYRGSLAELVPQDESRAFDMYALIAGVVDDSSFFEIKPDYAREVVCGLGRIGGAPVGIVANQPNQKGGVLFVDSADKAARFVWLCDAFNIPLVFLADVPGFMVGTAVERQGIIRHGAKMITAVSEATVPKICVIVRKAYGAGLYAMAGPGFEPDATIALPTARIAVMGPEPAVNAVFYNKIQEIADPDERAAFVAERRREYEEDIDLLHLAGEGVVDAVVQPDDLRDELIRRLAQAATKDRTFSDRRHGVPPSRTMALVETDVGGEVATITLSRPEALNAISSEMAVEVAAAFRTAAAGDRTRVVVLAAKGERAFCVGADLKERNRLDHAGWLANRDRIAGMFAAIRETPAPTIASVFGFALGGGFELALSCDLVVASDDAVFGLPEATVGIVPGGGGTQLLARRCGLARAKELIFTGRRIPVEEAHAWGVVNRVAPPGELAEATAGLAAEIRRAAPIGVREAKRAIDGGFGRPLSEGLELEDAAWRAAVASDDRSEGVAAFAEKRDPRWTGR